MSGQRDSQSMALVAVAMVVLPLGTGAAERTRPPAKVTVPADFLEYLATLEGADDDWTDFELAEVPLPPVDSKTVAPKAAKAVESK